MHPESFINPLISYMYLFSNERLYLTYLLMTLMLICKVYIGSSELMSSFKLQTLGILRGQEEHHFLCTHSHTQVVVCSSTFHMHTVTPSLKKCCFMPNHPFFNITPFKGWGGNRNEVVYNLQIGFWRLNKEYFHGHLSYIWGMCLFMQSQISKLNCLLLFRNGSCWSLLR